MRHFLYLLLLPVLVLARAPSIAVDDLASRGVSRDDAAIISDRLRDALVQTGKVRVLEREEMDKILKEQAFQQSGACDQSECAVKIGRLLAVDRMVVGSVGRIGNLYTLGARILDVGSGEVLFTASRDSDGPLEDLLRVAVPDLAERLAAGALQTARGKTSEGGRADLEVVVPDSTATLLLDGRPVPGKGTFFLEGIESGRHRLEARTLTRQGVAYVDLEDDAVGKVEIELGPGTTGAKFFSEPSGAEVHVDGVDGSPEGTTPFRMDSLVVGRHEVTFRRHGHVDTTVSVEAVLGTVSSTRVRLAKGADLVFDPPPGVPVLLTKGRDTIRSIRGDRVSLREGRWRFVLDHRSWEPVDRAIEIRSGREDTLQLVPHFARVRIKGASGATVFLDGVRAGGSSAVLEEVEPGFRTITLKAEGKSDWSQSLHLHPGEEVFLDARMESRFAALTVRSNVPAAVLLDGVPAGVLESDSLRLARDRVAQMYMPGTITPSRFPRTHSWSRDTLAPGTHRIRVEADRRVPWESTVDLRPGAGVSYEVLLPWTAQEQARRASAKRNAARTTIGVVTGIAVAATTALAVQWSRDLDRARGIQAEYDAARRGFEEIKLRHAKAREDVAADRNRTLAAGALAFLGGAGFALTWAF